ncbi:MAG: thioredoxin [Xanthomonadales bacterium]|nr:thioredoxin [Xanthomonadales bacterium]
MDQTNPNIIDGTAENFEVEALTASKQQLVLVDVWAEWCEPCKTLMPILDKLVAEFADQVKLVKVNADEQQALAGQMGVQSLPTVLMLKDGQVADHFMGVQPESVIRDKIIALLPEKALSPAELIDEAISTGQLETARSLLEEQFGQNPDDNTLKLKLVQVQMQLGETQLAEDILQSLPLEIRDSMEGKALFGALEFSKALSDAPTVAELEKTLADNGDEHNSRYQLAAHALVSGDYRKGMEQLLELLQRNREYQDGLAQRSLVAAFQLANDPQLIREMRTRMARLLN